ncbi:MAG: EscU/YscU/HrcU family type III secretion system export apparatus switch protein [Pseudomonadota bacterium]
MVSRSPSKPSRAAAAAIRGTKRGPDLVASGYGDLARKILDLAFAAGIKVREDADLASMLAALDQCEEIPPHALYAVLEILEHVYYVEGRDGLLGHPTR